MNKEKTNRTAVTENFSYLQNLSISLLYHIQDHTLSAKAKKAITANTKLLQVKMLKFIWLTDSFISSLRIKDHSNVWHISEQKHDGSVCS